MQHITGPDFPTKGIIMGRNGIRQAYATGRGKIVVRAKTEFEEFGRDHRTRIIVTELPYQVNKRQLIRNIADQVKDKRIEGISDLRDESDRNGMRMVIELKKDANAQVVLNKLFTQTQLQSSFSIIMLALVQNQSQPKILSLRHILDEYLTFQEDVITRRTRYDLKKALERAHLLQGLIIAQDNIDEVIRIIRNSYDDARENLMARFGLDEVQAQAILDMRLKALQGLDREKLQAEYDELQEKIKYYNELLSDPEKIKGVLKDELIAIRDKYGNDRLTEIQDVEEEIDFEDLIEEETCAYTLTNAGYIKRMPVTEYRAQGRGGKGIRAQSLKDEDFVHTVFTASSHDYIFFFTDKGRVYRKKGYNIPMSGRTSKGTNIVNVLPLDPNERVTAMIHTSDLESEDVYLFMVTLKGTVKRLLASSFKNIRSSGIRALTLDEGDELISVCETHGDDNILIATHYGYAICFNENDVRAMGREAIGVRGIRLREEDFVIGAVNAKPDGMLLSITENGYGKRTPIEEYVRGNDGVPQKRGGKGIKNYNVTDKTGRIAGIKLVNDDEDVLLISDDGTMIRTPAETISVLSRATQGVRLMRVADGARLISVATTEKGEDSSETEE
jgi:DNA gyrase subunit A